jgi:site-specific recombinase XerD
MGGELITKEQEKALTTIDLKREWLEHERLRGQSQNTIRAYRKGLEIFLDWIQDQGIQDPRASHLRQFKIDLLDDYAPQTVNLRLSGVRAFYRFLVETDRIPYNPAGEVRGAKRSKSTRHKRDELTSGEVLALLATCGETPEGARDRAIISLMAYCGLRRVEIHRADIDNLKTENDRMVLEVWGKGRAEADEIVVIPRDQENVIRAWLAYRKGIEGGRGLFYSLSNRSKGGRLSLRAITWTIRRRMDQAGITGERKTVHSLRHSAITSAIRNGASPLQVQAMARHASFDTTLNYIHEINRVENPAEDLINYD